MMRTLIASIIALGFSYCFNVTQLSADELTPGIIHSEFIYTEAPFPECHASTIVETPQGLVAAWFGGTYEKHEDVGIWVARKSDSIWTAPVEVANGIQADGRRHPCWNPVLFQAPQGPLLLFYKVGPSPSTWWGMLIKSSDGGQTWDEPFKLPDNIFGPIKNKPVLLPDGQLLCGTSTEDHGWRVHMESTSDWGATWNRTEALNDATKIQAIQPAILLHPEGSLQILCRGRGTGKIVESWSSDNGKTWTAPQTIELPNPNSGIDAVTLRDGPHVLIYNHTARGRSPLNLAVSKDGRTWQAAAVLENVPGEYSYPAVIQSADGLLHVTYTWKRQRVKHIVADPDKLELRAIVDGVWPE